MYLATFICVVSGVVVELMPLSSVFLRLLITLICLRLGLNLLRLAFLALLLFEDASSASIGSLRRI